MSHTYRCWAHSEGQTQDDATLIEGGGAKDAAKSFAEEWFFKSGDNSDLDITVYTVRVGEEPPKVRGFQIYVECEVTFSTTRIPPDEMET